MKFLPYTRSSNIRFFSVNPLRITLLLKYSLYTFYIILEISSFSARQIAVYACAHNHQDNLLDQSYRNRLVTLKIRKYIAKSYQNYNSRRVIINIMNIYMRYYFTLLVLSSFIIKLIKSLYDIFSSSKK